MSSRIKETKTHNPFLCFLFKKGRYKARGTRCNISRHWCAVVSNLFFSKQSKNTPIHFAHPTIRNCPSSMFTFPKSRSYNSLKGTRFEFFLRYGIPIDLVKEATDHLCEPVSTKKNQRHSDWKVHRPPPEVQGRLPASTLFLLHKKKERMPIDRRRLVILIYGSTLGIRNSRFLHKNSIAWRNELNRKQWAIAEYPRLIKYIFLCAPDFFGYKHLILLHRIPLMQGSEHQC